MIKCAPKSSFWARWEGSEMMPRNLSQMQCALKETSPVFIFVIARRVGAHQLANCRENSNKRRQGETLDSHFECLHVHVRTWRWF